MRVLTIRTTSTTITNKTKTQMTKQISTEETGIGAITTMTWKKKIRTTT